MDIYKIIRESKEDYSIDETTVDYLYSTIVEKTLLSMINNEEDNDEFNNIAEKILKKRDDYHTAKKENKMEQFISDLNNDFIKVFKSDRKERTEEFINYINQYSKNIKNTISKINNNPDILIFKLFLKEYNEKESFTWKQFKNIKRIFEKSHPLEGENIYNLKSLLEKDPNIEKIKDETVFSKSLGSLSKKTIEKINDKIEN